MMTSTFSKECKELTHVISLSGKFWKFPEIFYWHW